MPRSKSLSLGLILTSLFSYSAATWADSVAQPLPFAQDWTNTSLIQVNDDWSGVPGVIGYRGNALTASTGTDPQTILIEGTSPVNVNANQAAPNTNTTGGVAEFHSETVPNPTIALQGSGTADAPFILIHLNTSGMTSIQVAYLLRDLDGSIDNAIQPVALQYVILTLTLNVVDLVAMGCYTAFAAKVLMMLKDPDHIRWTNRGIGSLFMAAGGALAVFKRG